MLTYEPGGSPAHTLDARAKLCFQVGFAVGVFAAVTPREFAAFGGLVAAILAAGRTSPLAVVRAYWPVFAFLALGPVIAGATLGPPWIRAGPAVDSVRSVGRVAPVVFVSAVYVRTTPVRETRAAIQWLVPGRTGRVLGVGVGLVVRFLPVVLGDLRAVRTAIRARAGDRRRFTDRVRRVVVRGLQRTLLRADRLAVALRARCFAWNPTLPPLSFRRRDYGVLAASGGLVLFAVL
mgnify:CR=1 FL=1